MTKSTNKSTSKEEQPWYEAGLRFTCTGCGNCCTGAPGYVWVNQQEINDLAARLDMSVEAFEAQFVRYVGIRRSLVEYENGDCVFFDNKSRKCTVYDERPRQCRTWPFWKSNLRTPQSWEETCQACPGSGHGKLYQLEAIEEQAGVINV